MLKSFGDEHHSRGVGQEVPLCPHSVKRAQGPRSPEGDAPMRASATDKRVWEIQHLTGSQPLTRTRRAESLCCILETNTTLQINDTFTIKKKLLPLPSLLREEIIKQNFTASPPTVTPQLLPIHRWSHLNGHHHLSQSSPFFSDEAGR